MDRGLQRAVSRKHSSRDLAKASLHSKKDTVVPFPALSTLTVHTPTVKLKVVLDFTQKSKLLVKHRSVSPVSLQRKSPHLHSLNWLLLESAVKAHCGNAKATPVRRSPSPVVCKPEVTEIQAGITLFDSQKRRILRQNSRPRFLTAGGFKASVIREWRAAAAEKDLSLLRLGH